MSKKNSNKLIAYAVVRISTCNQTTDSQASDIVKVADDWGYYIPSEYIFEEQISGYDEDYNQDRDSIIQLRNAIQERKPDAIFIWELSRLTRTPDKVEKYISEFSLQPMIPLYIYKFGKEGIWTIQDGKILFENTKAIRACADAVYEELMQIRERTMRGRNAKAKKGLNVGHVADGYIVNRDDTFSVDETRKKDIVRLFKLYAEHSYTTDQVAAILNSEHIKTATHYRATSDLFPKYTPQYIRKKKGVETIIDRTKSEWTGELVLQTLRNKWYRGKRTYTIYDEVVEFDVPRLIEDQDLLSRVDEKLSSNRIIPKSTASKNTYLLSTLIFCGQCGKPMYGHVTGRYNHYYCSSMESGKKCGNRGVNKENVEAIVLSRIQFYAMQDLYRETDKSIFLKFYKNEDVLQQYKDSLKVALAAKQRAESNIIRYNEDINQYIELQGSARQKDLQQRYTRKINELYDKIDTEKKNIIQKDAAITRTKQLIDATKNIKQVITEISKTKSVSESLGHVREIIKRIELYSPDYNSHVIRITYVNGFTEDIIYNYSLLREGYIPMWSDYFKSKEEDDETNPSECIRFNEETGYIELKGSLYWLRGGGMCIDDENGWLKDIKNRQEYCKRNNITEKEEIDRLVKEVTPISPIYEDRISVRDYILEYRKYSKTRIYPFVKEVPTGERAEKQLKYSHEYSKKQNTGLPTSLPRLDREYDNESIIKECKHLYNRLYKIKNHKRMSPDEKEQKISEIKNKLALLNATKKYLTREEQLKKHLG